MHIKDEFHVPDLGHARAVIRGHPLATLVTPDLRASHMPCLLDQDASGLAILSHVARADPVSERLDQPLLAIFHGPSGYVSASWYASDTIPTWNYVTLHVRGTPEPFEDSLPVLRRTVDHFESAVERPWSLDRMGDTARDMADKVIAFRLRAEAWHLEAKLSQDKPAEEQARLLNGVSEDGPYLNRPLAAAMRAAQALAK